MCVPLFIHLYRLQLIAYTYGHRRNVDGGRMIHQIIIIIIKDVYSKTWHFQCSIEREGDG